MKEQLLQHLLHLRQKTNKGDVGPSITDEFNLILDLINDDLGLDLHDLSVQDDELKIQQPLRHADGHRPLTDEERTQRFIDRDDFRERLHKAIDRLNAHVPPKDRIGFV